MKISARKAIIMVVSLAIAIALLVLVITKHEHKWVPATCAAPMTCSVCGATEGGTLPHTWVAATHQTLKTCSVCQATEGDYLYVDMEIIATASEFVLASDQCVIVGDGIHYGVMKVDGTYITQINYVGYKAFLQDDCFALYTKNGDLSCYDLFNSKGEIIWTNEGEYKDYEIVGMAGGYLTLNNWEDNTWYYLDVNTDFSPSLYIDGDSMYKETLSLVNNGYITARNVGSLGYPFLRVSDKAFVKGSYNEDCFIDSRGCPVNDNNETLVAMWKIKSDGFFKVDSCGFYNVMTGEYTKINDWYDDNYRMRHIYCFNGAGINEYDCIGDYMLIQTGELDNEEKTPVYNLYNYRTGKFITDYGLEGIFMGYDLNIGAVYDDLGNVKYVYLDSSCKKVGNLYDSLSYFADDYAMVVSQGMGYFINADMGIISAPVPAESVYHRYGKIFVVNHNGEASLIRIIE